MDEREHAMAEERRGLAAVLGRLEEIERENRRLRRYGTAMLIALAVLVGLGVASIWYYGGPGQIGSAQIVTARQFVLRDARGAVRGAWGTTEDGSVRLALNDVRGQQRIRLSLLSDGSAGLSFADTADRKLAVLGLLADHTTTLALTDPGGVPRAVLGVNPNGTSNIVFADQTGATRAGLGVDTRGLGTFTLAERSGGGAPEELLDTLQAGQNEPEPETQSPPPRRRR